MTSWSAPDEAVATTVADLQAAISDTLGVDLVGLYLTGSLVVGDFDPGLSDIDCVAITGQLSAEQVDALGTMHERFAAAHPEWQNRIEVAYVTSDDIRNFRTVEPSFPVISPGEPFHLRHEPLNDWADHWYLLLAQHVVLAGRPAEEVFPEVSRDEFFQGVLRYIRELEERARRDVSPGNESYIVLTACRALHCLEVGTQTSKRAAGIWMQDAHPEWSPLIERALEWRYIGPRDRHAALPETHELLRFVEARLASANDS